MNERTRRSRDASSRYSIETLFPGLGCKSVKVIVEDGTPGGKVEEKRVVKEVKKRKEGEWGDNIRVEEGAGSSGGGGVRGRKRAASPLKPTTQPKHISLLSVTKMSKKSMLEAFQPWVLHTYGDSAKTKTITKKKYYRIVKTLRGEEINNAENSKFRFWVKAKGFHVGLPPGHSNLNEERQTVSFTSDPDLYVPTTVKEVSGGEKAVYKRVAVVEHFFDIIYTVHVETEAKNGKHAGQKRTYRAITEMYAFLPREAVTKFLLQCMECQKRGGPAGDQTLNGKMARLSEEAEDGGKRTQCVKPKLRSSRKMEATFSVPFTTTYLRQKKQERKVPSEQQKLEVHEIDEDCDDEEADTQLVESVPQMDQDQPGGKSRDGKNGNGDTGTSVEWLGYHPIALKKEAGGNCNNNIYSNGKQDFREQSSPLSLSDRCGVNQEAGQDETSSNGNKDDEDDDDDESEDKIDTQTHDPERLKAFNMFVRLFVDENLDRMVPISKQPKEKIQAIIDSCTRQFPEFAERARKRIRTYLKSCRRNKRSRDSNGWESSRPTPAHLTSVQAEQILAQACENESQNAKRMRMGLEPVGQPLPVPQAQQNEKCSLDVAENGHGKGSGGKSSTREDSDKSSSTSPEKERPSKVSSGPTAVSPAIIGAAADMTPQNPPSHKGSQQGSKSPSSSSENQHPSGGIPAVLKAHDRSPLVDYSRTLNGNGMPNMSMYRPNFGQAFQRPAPFPTLFPPATATTVTFPHSSSPVPITNGEAGPTDLSMKAKPLLTHKLNATEMATVRQLITGYRESAAFLLRSADELEQLLIQQQ